MVQRPGQYGADDEMAKSLLDQEEKPVEKAADAPPVPAKNPDEPPRPLTWEEKIKEAGLTEDNGYAILNAVLDSGFYSKEFALFGGRVKFTLRTREGYSRQRIANALDELRTNDPRVHYQTQARLCLAGSLLSFRDKAFNHPSARNDVAAHQTAFNERLVFVDGLSDTMLDTLYDIVMRFDTWTYAALWNGAPTAF